MRHSAPPFATAAPTPLWANPTTPHPQLRKINCGLQIAGAENLHTLSQLSAVPPNRLVLFGSYGIVPSSKMFIIRENIR